jgi:N-acetyl-gamma-glutamyl-phosphate reductase
MIKAGIYGGAGYTGGELLRILVNHPEVTLHFVQSKSNAGAPVHHVHQDLVFTDLVFTEEIKDDADVIFICSGHGEAVKFLSSANISENTKVIDLGNDFRLKEDATLGNRNFVYGLPEYQREAIRNAANIANPGCFATAIQLGLLPLAELGEVHEVYTTGITGSTGAGQSLSATGHFSWRANNIQAYKTLTHQHIGEIQQTLNSFKNNKGADVQFVPWRGDFTRGIFISSQIRTERSLGDLYDLYNSFYQTHPFTQVLKTSIHLKQVVNTNHAIIQLEKEGNNLVIHSAIDNLLKGASGQAVQNMNLIFGLEETTGLRLKANYF